MRVAAAAKMIAHFHNAVRASELALFNAARARLPSPVKFLDFPALCVAEQHGFDVSVDDHGTVGKKAPVDRLRVPRNSSDLSRVNNIYWQGIAFACQWPTISSTTLVVRTAIMAWRPGRLNFAGTSS